MPESLTKRQRDVLDVVERSVVARRIAPTLAEISAELGICSVTAHEHLAQLERKGWITRPRVRGSSRNIALTQGVEALLRARIAELEWELATSEGAGGEERGE